VILDAATQLFGKHGYHATTVPMIVEEAKVSTGSFCMYFRNKEDVFDAALEELGEAIDRALDEVKQSQPDPLKRIAQGPSHCSYSSRKIRSGPAFCLSNRLA
jgi:AcrR family transcriptional regulator